MRGRIYINPIWGVGGVEGRLRCVVVGDCATFVRCARSKTGVHLYYRKVKQTNA